MKPKLILCLALVLSGGGFASIAAAQEANSSIRETYQISLPTKLMVKHLNGILKIQTDKQTLEVTNLSIGTNMLVGIWCDVYVYETGTLRPTNYCHVLEPDSNVFCPNIAVVDKLEFDPFIFYCQDAGLRGSQTM